MKLLKTTFIVFCCLSTFLSGGDYGKIKLIAGSGNPGFKDGVDGEMNKPIRFAPFDKNSVIVADISNHAIRLVYLDGKIITIAGGPESEGYLDGPASIAKFNSPHGVAYDSKSGKIYVAEAGNHVIRVLSPEEKGSLKFIVSTFAGMPDSSGFKDGLNADALFNSPHSIAITADKSIIVADIGNSRIRLVKDGLVTTIAGNGAPGLKDGEPLKASFKYPMDMAFSGKEMLIIDAGNHLIRKLIPGKAVSTFKVNGELKTPHGITVDKSGTLYIANMGTHEILTVDKNGNIKSIAGTEQAGPALTQLDKPAAVLVHANYLWIADLNNHQIKVIAINK